MTVFFVLVAVFAAVSSTEALKCRRCNAASSLDECTFSVPCGQNEICYMDKVLTEWLTIEYNGGCRPRDVCSRSPTATVGKRAGYQMICTGCCDTDARPECNTKTCGITSSYTQNNQCYNCRGGSAVSDPQACSTISSCQADEMCGTETYGIQSHVKYEFKCINRNLCSLLTREALKRMDECKTHPEYCGDGRRQFSTKICTACCGDSLCNSNKCPDVLEHLYRMWKAGVLDLHTLKFNGTTQVLASTTPGGMTSFHYTRV